MDKAERLLKLEYAIRQSLAVRDDQEDPADLQHLDEATACGIDVTPELSKGDLLSLVQTRIRAI
ncbi:MAG TPA: hypothetical protein VGE56_06575 [Rhodocyclaceae bacterium]